MVQSRWACRCHHTRHSDIAKHLCTRYLQYHSETIIVRHADGKKLNALSLQGIVIQLVIRELLFGIMIANARVMENLASAYALAEMELLHPQALRVL